MINKLLQWLVQEIPEELSVCEFVCRKTECTISDWAVCELRHQDTRHDNGAARHDTYEVHTEAAA